MSDPVHNAVLGSVSGQEKELKGGRGPWIERSYPKGDRAISRGELVALAATDVENLYVKGLAYPWVSGDAAVGAVKGVALSDAAAEDPSVDLLVFGTVNRSELRVGGGAPDAEALTALEERHIYPVG